MSVRSLSEALDVLDGRESRKVANNTKLLRFDTVNGPLVKVVLHDTAVVTYLPTGLIKLDSGGWLTHTTMERVNDFTPADLRVWSDKGRWTVGTGLTWDPIRDTSWPFTDGVIVQRDHTETFVPWLVLPSNFDQQREDRHNAHVKAMLPRFVRAVAGRVETSMLPVSTCAMCYRTEPGLTGELRILGDQMGDRQHLMDHLVDGVVTRQLADAAAMDARGIHYPYAVVDDHLPGWVHRRVGPRELRAFMLNRLLVGAVASAHGRRPLGEPSWAMAVTQRNAIKAEMEAF